MAAMDFRNMASDIHLIEEKRVARSELGTLGFPGIEANIIELKRQMSLFGPHAENASDELLNEATGVYQTYLKVLQRITFATPADFARQREEFAAEVRSSWDGVLNVWPKIAMIVVDKKGLLADPEALNQKLKASAGEAEESLRKLSREILEKAEKEASRIVDSGRATVRSFSVKKAQDQFDLAHTPLLFRSVFWGLTSLGLFVWFIWFALHVYHTPPILALSAGSTTNLSLIVYFLAIRVTILSAIAAMLAFCLRMLRAHPHMTELNNHRRRIANSMSAFVESAHYPKQQDYIFGRLVDAVVNFGDSGLLDKESDVSPSLPTVAIEAITKNLTK